MERFTRRRTLRATGLGVGLLCAGCLRGSSDDGDGDSDGDGVGGTTDVNGSTVLQLGPRSSAPDWASDDEATGSATLYADGEAVLSALDLERYSEQKREEIEGLVSGADHEAIQILSVRGVGPNTCYTEMEVSNLRVTDDGLTGRATATDTSEDGSACGEALTYPAALVEVLYGGTPPTTGALTLVDGSGDESTVEVATGESS